ncbi:MAG: DMT family transporter [Rubrivivax sp.]
MADATASTRRADTPGAAARRGPPAWLPLAAAAAAAAFFIAMDATAKGLTTRFDSWQITFLRFASGSLFALPLWLWRRTPLPRGRAWRLHAARSALLLLALLTWFHSLSLLPLVQSVAVGYTAPIFISLLAIVLLHERPSRWIGVALALGAAGVAVSLAPELGAAAGPGGARRVEGLLSAAVSALAYSGVVILARHQAQRDAIWTILLVQNLLPTLLLALPLAWRWQPMAAADAGPVLLMGALATAGLLCVTWAFMHIEASRAAPLEYTGFVWAALLGYALFGEVPTSATLMSAALIVAGCLLLLRR